MSKKGGVRTHLFFHDFRPHRYNFDGSTWNRQEVINRIRMGTFYSIFILDIYTYLYVKKSLRQVHESKIKWSLYKTLVKRTSFRSVYCTWTTPDQGLYFFPVGLHFCGTSTFLWQAPPYFMWPLVLTTVCRRVQISHTSRSLL